MAKEKTKTSTKNAKLRLLMDNVVTSVMCGMQTAPQVETPETKVFRVSSMPYCSILHATNDTIRKEDYRSRFYTDIGTAMHELMQEWMGRSINGYRLFGNWKCRGCAKTKSMCVLPKECNTCAEKARKGKKRIPTPEESWNYEEIEVEYKGLTGHVDKLVKITGPGEEPAYMILDYKCVVGSTMVNTLGGFLHMDELAFKIGENSYKGVIDTPNGPRSVSKSFKQMAHKTVAIKTANGFALEGTPIHPVKVFREDLSYVWVRMKDLKKGDWIVSKTSSNSPTWGTNKIDKRLLRLAGWLTANGSGELTAAGGRLRLSSADKAVQEGFVNDLTRLTGSGPSAVYTTSAVPDFDGNSGLYKLMRAIGFIGGKSCDKNIPLSIRGATKACLDTFLSAYFECDSGTGNKNSIVLTSASEKLAHELHTILFHGYGILGRLYTAKTYATNSRNPTLRDYHVIEISGDDRVTFLDAFPESKVAKVHGSIIRQSVAKATSGGAGYDHGLRRYIPHVVNYRRLSMREARVGLSRKTYRFPDGSIRNIGKGEGIAYFGLAIKRDGISERASKVLPVIDKASVGYAFDPRFADVMTTIVDDGYHFEQVVSVTHETTKKMVYDVTVPDGHCFTSNCLVSHNTTTLPDYEAAKEAKKAKKKKGKKLGSWTAANEVVPPNPALAIKYPVPYNIDQISAYCALLTKVLKLNIVGWSLVYVDRSNPISGKSNYHPVTHVWTKADQKLWIKRLDEACAAAPAAQKIFEMRCGLSKKKPTEADWLKVVKTRPCRTKDDFASYMKSSFHYERDKTCVFLGGCTSCTDKALAARLAKDIR